jgi:general stress protein 26
MTNSSDLQKLEGLPKLKHLVEEINICLFCTNLKSNDGSTCRPMASQGVDDDGNLWFLSDKNSDKNKEIHEDKHVQLFFSHPGKSSYLVVNGEAEVLIDTHKIEELWTPFAKIWFKEGKNDPNLSIIKVATKSAYYWDTDGNKMINFFKMVASVATGASFINGTSGTIKI